MKLNQECIIISVGVTTVFRGNWNWHLATVYETLTIIVECQGRFYATEMNEINFYGDGIHYKVSDRFELVL